MSETSISSGTGMEPETYAPGRTTAWNQSWNEIYEQFADAIRARARAEGLNEHSQDDVLQEVMVTIIRCKSNLEPGFDRTKVSFRKWFWGVVRNRIREARRRDRKQTAVSPEMDAATSVGDLKKIKEEDHPPEDFEKREEQEWAKAQLANAMRRVQQSVTPQNFAIYTALFRGEATPDELATRYGMTRNAIDAVNFRCRDKMKSEIQKIRNGWELLCQIESR